MSAAYAIQAAIFTLLRANAGLSALLASSVIDGDSANKAVYDQAPQVDQSEGTTAFPYVVIGEDTAGEFDADDFAGQETTITLHVWSRYRGKKEVKQILDALYSALHNAALTVTGHIAVYCYFEYSESFQDPDGVSMHGVARYRIVTQRN